MLGRLLRLGLDEQKALEPDPVLVLGDHRQEAGELGLLAGEVGVEQRLVALATTPQHVVRPIEPLGHLEHGLDLRRRVGEDLRVGIGGRAGRIARVTNRFAVPHSSSHAGAGHVASASATIASRLERDSANVRPSGAMSRSWKQ